MEAKIVIGLGFGDEGKEITTDFLCSLSPDPLVIRFSGGQQAGHTVMLGGKKHVHSSYGSGTLRGVPTYFSEHTTIYPVVMERERRILEKKGIKPKLFVHPFANLTSPYDVAWNRDREKRLGHGSCGLGIGATMKRNLETPYKLYAMDLFYPSVLKQKLLAIEKYYRHELGYAGTEQYKEVDMEMSYFLEAAQNPAFKLAGYELLDEYHSWIFEGSQGILLDKKHGFFPNVTYGNTTSRNVFDILGKAYYPAAIRMYYVTRCYQTRHGAGWMSNETPIKLINNEEEINMHNDWQKDFRVGEIDYNLLNYSLQLDKQYSPDATERNLVVTCMDQRPDFNFDYSKLETKFANKYETSSPYSESLSRVA